MKSIRVMLMIIIALLAMNVVTDMGRVEKPAYAVGANGPEYKVVDTGSESSNKIATDAGVPLFMHAEYFQCLINANASKGYRYIETINYGGKYYLVFER